MVGGDEEAPGVTVDPRRVRFPRLRGKKTGLEEAEVW